MKVLLLDNYDSFTFNLLHYLEQLDLDVSVFRNDDVSWEQLDTFSHIVISPGPGLPAEAGICQELIRRYATSKSILGVCLGAQALALHFGGEIYNQAQVTHGLQRQLKQAGTPSRLLKDLPPAFPVGLYHSWAIRLPADGFLIPVAYSENHVLMAFEHPQLPLAGVQFHPESIMSEYGLPLLRNWLAMKKL